MAGKKNAGRTKRILALILLFGPAFTLIFIATRGCNHKFKELDDFGPAMKYEFTDAYGETHTYRDFSNQIVLVSVLQSNCLDSCSVSLWHLDQGIYQHIRKNKKKLGSVRMISYVTDGEGNPVEDLSTVRSMMEDLIEEYDPEIWYIATGDVRSLYDFKNNNERLLHTGDEYYGGEAFQELLLLLDRKNHLRMVLSGKSKGMIRRMKEHIALLLKQYDKEKTSHEK
ncbi:MAG: hypothetical protein A3D92_18820 [Bacteroidetes bacterium RIFCSPHIGHO2_02_FULL_44_7]|nr:MAG: hypothetical protein A3D92_18820 [Bacteroidetes bacterium RIFCSPHIGHO2_02_FULL_44_7]